MRLAAILCLLLALTGCGAGPTAAPSPEPGLSIRGNVHGGQQPIVGAHVYLFAANTTGYGQPSVSLLNASATGFSDSLGAYLLTDTNGGFTITNDYTCTAGTQVYLYVLGGNPGAGVNSAVGLLAILGQCPASGSFITTVPFVTVNEASTIAAAYAMAGFATDATHVSSSGTPLAQTGIANAFANAANLEDISTGVALTKTPAGNGTVPQANINTLANILAACVNSTGPSSAGCSTLLSHALSGGSTGTAPTDTATAAINIAHNPASNIAALFALPMASAPFAPALSTQPKDFTLLLTFTGGGLGTAQDVAIDQFGNAWIANQDSSVVELSSLGVILSGASGFTDGNQRGTLGISIDLSGNVWIPNYYTNSVTEFSNSGSILSGAGGYTNGIVAPSAIGVDASGNAWVGTTPLYLAGYGAVIKLSGSGTVLSGANGYTGGGLYYPSGLGFDGSGNVWIANYYGGVTKLSGSGVALSGPNGYIGGGMGRPRALAIDSAGNVWIASSSPLVTVPGGVTKFSNSGSVLITANGFDGNGGSTDTEGIAIDGAGNVWATNQFPSNGIVELSNSGAVLSTTAGYTGGGILGSLVGIAIDGSGNVWVADQDFAVHELVGAATPVITPIVAGLPQTPTTDGTSKLGTRP